MNENDSLFEIVSYLISAAHLTLVEPPRHGSARLIVGALRLIAAAEERGEADATLLAWKAEMDDNVMKVMNFYPEYERWLGGLTREVAEEVTRRNLAE
jgi:hypothetical protein